jgi:hypothetical protein
MLRIVKVHADTHDIEHGVMFQPQAPHPVEDTFGTMKAVALLDHSLNAVNNVAHVKFNTIRKTRSALLKLERTSDSELEHASLSGYKLGDRMLFTNTCVYSLWFDK